MCMFLLSVCPVEYGNWITIPISRGAFIWTLNSLVVSQILLLDQESKSPLVFILGLFYFG